MNEVEDSFSSNVYKCKLLRGATVFIKIPYTKLKFQRELEAYELLKGRIAIPDMLNCWFGDEKYPGAFLLSELKGQTLTAEASAGAMYEVGAIHASIHSIQLSPKKELTAIQNEFPNWSDFLESKFYSFAVDVRDVLDEHLYEQAIEKFEIMKRQLPAPDGPSLVHMDFRPANIIVDDNQVSGIIDFESVRFGSTEIDFTKIYRDILSCDHTLYQAYKEGYKSIRPLIDLDIVLPFYRFTDAFNSIGWCKKRGMEKNAAFLVENLAILKKLLPSNRSEGK
ncbi:MULTISPECIES: phosphotransferase family protein [Bacillaceae]|uniref:phosphotransferase family protein n=1 Tax=Bacillaceae TaxID=186817 RepID=UPI001CEF6E87|nr:MULTISPECIES: aminoglycoside phosphotransferase family protein [Bacillaceae]